MFDTPPLTEAAVAAAAAAVVVALAVFHRRPTRDTLLLWCAAMSVALVMLGQATWPLLVAPVAVSASLQASDPRVRRILAILAPAIVIAVLTNGLEIALVVGAILGTALATPACLWVEKVRGQAVVVALLAISAAGIYVNVPDTEQITVLASGLCVLTVALVFLPAIRTTQQGRVVALVLIVSLVMGAAAVGARGRPAAYVAVIGALGVLIAEPVAGFIRRGTVAHPIVLFSVHVAVVFTCSRVAGTADLAAATWIVALGLLSATLVVLILPRRDAATAEA